MYELICFMNSYMTSGVPRFQMWVEARGAFCSSIAQCPHIPATWNSWPGHSKLESRAAGWPGGTPAQGHRHGHSHVPVRPGFGTVRATGGCNLKRNNHRARRGIGAAGGVRIGL